MKTILDATCGGRMMWFEKNHPNVVYMDQRTLPEGTLPISKGWSVNPDVQADFTALPFKDNTFHMVIYDPPHIYRKSGKSASSNMGISYGILTDGWEYQLAGGFAECWRVLDSNGFLIFKWNDTSISLKEVLGLVPPGMAPLFGHRAGQMIKKTGHWITFLKI